MSNPATPRTWMIAALVVAAGIVATGVAVGVALAVSPPAAPPQAISSAAAAPTTPAAAAPTTEAKEAPGARQARLKATSSTLGTEQRLAWVRNCVEKLKCSDEDIEAMADGAPPAEREAVVLAAMAVAAARFASGGEDGAALSIRPITNLCDVFRLNGLALLAHMPTAELREAKKDPDGARGKALRVSGTVVEIQTTKGLTEGGIVTEDQAVVRFVTPMATDGIYDNSWATFRGIFVQRYIYKNAGGGETNGALVVGAFDLPKNKRGTRPSR